jgi:hypothetical protein
MAGWTCVTCGVQLADTEADPTCCAICEDERQYVGVGGQQWTTMAELGCDHSVVLREEEPDLVGVGVELLLVISFLRLLHRIWADTWRRPRWRCSVRGP